jgi:hypothetical protein
MWEQFDSIKNTQPMNFWGHSGVTYAQPGERKRETPLASSFSSNSLGTRGQQHS